MQGSINLNNGVQFTDLLQMLSGGHLSGRLEIKDNLGTKGRLEFNHGAICLIEYAGLDNVAALAKLLKETELHFQFLAAAPIEAPGIYSNTTELLMEAALCADTEIPAQVTQEPSYFTIKNRVVLNTHTNEEAQEILAEFDFLHHNAVLIGSSLGLGGVEKLMLKEDQALLAFHVLAQEDVLGYQSLKPTSLTEAFNLL